MKRKLDIKSVVLGALLGAFINLSLGAANGGSTVWEYKTMRFNSDERADSELNHLAQQRWTVESFAVTFFPPNNDLQRIYLLKRAKQ